MLMQLRALGVNERIDAVIAVPADLDVGALTSLRGALHAAGVDARDFVDAAALAGAAVADRSHYVVLEAGWRSATATRVGGGADCAVEEAFVSERANLLDVYDLWLVGVAAAMVKNTRFDPLLSLAVEQRLFAALPQVAARAATEGRAEAAIEEGESRFAVEIDAQLFADAAQPFYRELARLARSARIAGQGAALLLPAESRRWPGFLARALENEQDGLIIAPPGLGAVAASLQVPEPEAAPRLRRHVARLAEHALSARSSTCPRPWRLRAVRCRSRTSCLAATRCVSPTWACRSAPRKPPTRRTSRCRAPPRACRGGIARCVAKATAPSSSITAAMAPGSTVRACASAPRCAPAIACASARRAWNSR